TLNQHRSERINRGVHNAGFANHCVIRCYPSLLAARSACERNPKLIQRCLPEHIIIEFVMMLFVNAEGLNLIFGNASVQWFKFVLVSEFMAVLKNWIQAREVAFSQRDNNRKVRPFSWGIEYLNEFSSPASIAVSGNGSVPFQTVIDPRKFL